MMPLKRWSVDSVTLNFLEGKRSSPSMWYCHMKKSGAIRIQCNQAANDQPQSTRLSTTASRAAASRRDFRITIRICCRYLLRRSLVFKSRTLNFFKGKSIMKSQALHVKVSSFSREVIKILNSVEPTKVLFYYILHISTTNC